MQIIKNDEWSCDVAVVDYIPTKRIQNKRSDVFSSVNDIRLKCFNGIAYWLKNVWHTLIQWFPINNHAGVIEKSVTKVNNTHAIDNANSDYDDTINLSLEPDEDLNEISKPSTNMSNETNKKSGRKKLIVGPSEETFLTLSHTLYVYSGLINHLMTKKRFEMCSNRPSKQWPNWKTVQLK